MSDTGSKTTSVLVTVAALVVTIAGMKAAAEIIVPFIFSVFIAIICAPPLVWMTHRRIPGVLAVLIILFAVVLIGFLLSLAIGTSIEQFTKALPGYQANLQAQFTHFMDGLAGLGIEVSETGFKEAFDPASAIDLVNKLLNSLGSLFANAFLIIFTVLLILLEASSFPIKLKAIASQSRFEFDYVDHFQEGVQRYIGLKTVTSFSTGALVSIMLVILGVDFPVLWGLLAFLLNYVPTIGSIIAAVPAVLLALVQFGVATALGTMFGFVVINVLVGNVIEPRLLGRGMGLSALIVFLSLIFWGWVFGPMGMILSVPLTMLAKLAMESHEQTKWIAILLGTGRPEQAIEK